MEKPKVGLNAHTKGNRFFSRLSGPTDKSAPDKGAPKKSRRHGQARTDKHKSE